MSQNWKEFNKQKHLFRSIYCGDCNQRKGCGKLNQGFCCPCQFRMEQKRAEEYSNYQQVYQRKFKERKDSYQQLKLLRGYSGCKQCWSKEIDAYDLYKKSQLVCQPCRMKKEGMASGSISFLEQRKWFKKFWKIDLVEWLENYQRLPVNKNCAERWIKDKQHLKNCDCLAEEIKELCSLVNDNLKRSWEKLRECKCVKSEKVRVSSDDYAWCDKCEGSIAVASKKRVIKNRNDPRFWGLEVREKVLCGKCLEKNRENMPPLRKAEFNRYRKVGRL